MKAENTLNPEWTKQEIEEAVTFVRLELYNRDLPCGPPSDPKTATRILSYPTVAV